MFFGKVPEKNDDAWGAIVTGIGQFTNATTIPMDVKSVEDKDSEKKVQVAAKIFVPAGDRLKIRDQVADYLERRLDGGETWAHEVRTGTTNNANKEQFDLVLRYQNEEKKTKPQVIRIEIKPTGAGGSGGGAAATKVQEIGMAAFLALRYKAGGGANKDLECHPTAKDPTKCLTTEDYDWGLSQVKSKDIVTSEQIQELDQHWKDAFILGSNMIYHAVGGTGWEFVRNDNDVEALISEKFNKIVAKDPQAHISQEDKWNPSDIWMVREWSTLKPLLEGEGTTDCLNNFFQLAFSTVNIPSIAKKEVPNKSLIGISLKKLGPTATLKPMNAMNAQALKQRENVGFDKGATLRELTSFSSMDVYLCYGPGRFKSFQARNFAGQGKGDWKLELKGEHAAHGKIQGSVMRGVLERAGTGTGNGWAHPIPDEPSSNFSNECKTSTVQSARRMYDKIYNKGKNIRKLMTDGQVMVTDEIYEFFREFTPRGFSKKPADKESMWIEIATKDASWRYSKLCGLRILSWLTSLSATEANRAFKEMYLYASSQSDKSSVYYKLS